MTLGVFQQLDILPLPHYAAFSQLPLPSMPAS